MTDDARDYHGVQHIGPIAAGIVERIRQDREGDRTMGSELTTQDDRREVAAAQAQPMTPMEMIGRALEMGVSADILKQMMDLRDREEASRARKAFNEAFAAFKSEAIRIARNRKVNDGPLKGRRYAELFSFVDAATPALSKHDLSHSWDITRDEKDWIEVTCTIEHSMGGSKKVALGGPPDTGGAKNALQARISTVTYLERATFKAACGLAEQGDDDDGSGGSSNDAKVNDEQLRELRALISETGTDIEKFCEVGHIEDLPHMLASDFADAKRLLEAKKRKMAS